MELVQYGKIERYLIYQVLYNNTKVQKRIVITSL
jgi:hypothetical protein